VLNDRLRRFPGLLCEHFYYDYRIWIDAVNNSPGNAFIVDPELSASRPNLRHWFGAWHPEILPLLQHAEKESSLAPCPLRERRTLDLTVQPYKRLILIWHWSKVCQV